MAIMRLLLVGNHPTWSVVLQAAFEGAGSVWEWAEAASLDAARHQCTGPAMPALVILDADQFDAGVDLSCSDLLALRVPVLVAGNTLTMADMVTWLRLGVSGCLAFPAAPRMVRAAVDAVMSGGRYVPADVFAHMVAALQHELAVDDIEEDTGVVPPAIAQEESMQLGISRRQYEILALLTRGLSIKRICQRLSISEGTAKTHVSALYRRLGARNRGEAIYVAARRGAKRLFDR